MKFYGTIEAMRMHPPSYMDPFVLQWEIPNPRDGVTRRYIVFDGIDEYMKAYINQRYTSCHEVFISQTYRPDDDIIGHPAYDIDIKHDTEHTLDLNDNWMQEFQEDLISILCKEYPSRTEEILHALSPNNWVWMTSPSSDKISKHLTISGICFSMWRTQMKILAKDIRNLNKPYSKYIDEGILRKLGSLRLPLNHKRHTYGDPDENGISPILKYSQKLSFDNPTHKFTDGLVMIHNANMYTLENGILLTPADLAPEYREILDSSYGTYIMPSLDIDIPEDEDINEHELIAAFHHIDRLYRTGLSPMSINGRYLPLIRHLPGTCPISGKRHDSDNAYIFKGKGKIFYGCHRGCSIKIGFSEHKYIDITPWIGSTSEDVARHIHETMDNVQE